MKNFLISSAANIILIVISYLIFRQLLRGPIRHKIYEKLMSSFALFVIYLFIGSLLITGITVLILYKTRYISYVNIAAPAILSIFVGFIMSTVPTRGEGDNEKNI